MFGCGSFGFLIWFPAAFPLKYALFNIAVGLAIIAVNAPYYQFLILCVYDTRQECNLAIPSQPAWMTRLTKLMRCQPKAQMVEATPVKPTEGSSAAANGEEELSQDAATKLDSIGQSALLPLFIDQGWDDLDALAGIQEHHVAAVASLKPGHIVRFLRRLSLSLSQFRLKMLK